MIAILVRVSLTLFIVTTSSVARADILDSETWDNHVEQVMQIQNDRQFRRTMNRGFDAMSAIGPSAGGGTQSAVSNATKQMALWYATLTVSPTFSFRELRVFLAQPFMVKHRHILEAYMRRKFTRYTLEAREALLNPNNIADARVFALQAAYHVARPDDPLPMTATFLIDTALSESMTQGLIPLMLTPAQKQDIRSYYVIERALFLTDVTPGYKAGDTDRRALAAAARTFIQKNIGVDPFEVSWAQLPCVGTSPVDCAVHTAMARNIVRSMHLEPLQR